ncbi:MAG: HD domain-containing protein [Candidatus ainarchaeum sp.]|nr:HD domain-containing protein [Candidatus ainarchaeum sp.]
MKAYISDLKEGFPVDSLFSVKYKRGVISYQNGWRFAFGASDKTGEIEVSFWGGRDRDSVQKAHDSFKEGDVVHVIGFVSVYKDKAKIDVNEGKGSISRATSFDLEDFLPESEKDLDGLYSELLAMVDSVREPGLKSLLDAFFRDEKLAAEFRRAPGAMYLHHAWLGGLLEHTVSVARIAREAAKCCGADVDLVTAGALLHDVGKMRELEVSTNIKIGEEGMLRGHTVLGEEMAREKARGVGLDEKLLLKLSHVILSHMGEMENGAPKKPMFVEAVIVHYSDELDTRASQFAKIRRETTTEDFRVYERHVGEVYLK